jgi:hypothetical protein
MLIQYYYNQLNKLHQSVYTAMKIGLTSLQTSFLVPAVDKRDLQDIFFKVRLDCPEIFYAVNFKFKMYKDGVNIEVIPEYLFKKVKILENKKAMNARITKLIRPVLSIKELEQEKYIHKFICEKVHYDKLKKPYSHEIIGPLGHGVGVCEGIAKTVKILCDILDIWCIIAISDANPEKNIKYRHAWNIVKIKGRYYNWDATFDNGLVNDNTTFDDNKKNKKISYVNFNRSDKEFFKNHEPSMYKTPKCE